MFNKYYQDELAFLREMGKEFSQAYPALAHMLAERGSDPDVERLMEGFAFLSGRIRQKLDDEFPEITHTLLTLLWPQYLRPIPSMSIVEFYPVPNAIRDRTRIPRGTQLASVSVEGTRCLFSTCYDVDISPLSIMAAEIEERPGQPITLRIAFQLDEGIHLNQLDMDRIRIFLHGETEFTSLLYLWLSRYRDEITIQGYLEGKPSQSKDLPPQSLQAVGFGAEDALLPYPANSFEGFRLLQEYFALPAKFMFFDICNVQDASDLETGNRFDLVISFKRPEGAVPRVTANNIRLNCSPVVNLFPHNADPISLEHNRVEYRVRPASIDAQHYETYSVDKVLGWIEGEPQPRHYPPFYSFTHATSDEPDSIYHQAHLRSSVSAPGTETYITFVSEQEVHVLPPAETISLDLTCTNRHLTNQLRIGDIQAATADSPEFASFKNISQVTPSVRPPLDQGLHWRLLSHLALNYLSLVDAVSLRSILEVYNFHALVDRQAARENQLRLEGIQAVRSNPMDWLVRGVPVRGTAIDVDLDENSFAGEGDLFLFATILNELFALYATINSFTRLTVRGVKLGEIYQWHPRLGRQILA
jgi:type VI secretion system protein ImpG